MLKNTHDHTGSIAACEPEHHIQRRYDSKLKQDLSKPVPGSEKSGSSKDVKMIQ